jgi:beta-lactamase class C
MQDLSANKKNKLLQWLFLAVMIMPAFFTFPDNPKRANPQKKDTQLLQANSAEPRWSEIPKRPVAFTSLQSYTDPTLTKKAKKIPAKTQLQIGQLGKNYFKLLDGTFVSNSKNKVIADLILTTTPIDQPVYLIKDTDVLYTPLTTYDNQVYSRLTGNQKVHAQKKATTSWGTYYEISFDGGKTGWIDSGSVTLENPKLESVQALLDQKYRQTDYSIYVKMLDSDFTAGVNPTKKMYSASLAKLPILYWTQKQINAGNASLNDKLVYNELVNEWAGAFKTQGTGFLSKTADNQSYTLLDLINRTAKDSDNVASNLLAYYETNQFSTDYRTQVSQIAGQPWNPIDREASSEMIGRILEALYHEGGAGFNALIGTDYDSERIPAKIPTTVKIAHKIGTADEFNHDAAIVFTSEPYILVIETNSNVDNDELATISQDIYEVMK